MRLPRIAIGVAIIIAVLAALSAFALIAQRGSSGLQAKSVAPTTSQQSANNQGNTSLTLLSAAQYGPYAYLISGNSLSPAASKAAAGFNVSRREMQNGSVEVTVAPVFGGSNITVVLKPGDRLYFIETSFADDSNQNEFSLADDGLVRTDAAGYITGIYYV